jgi:hypothetical protein
MAQAKGTEQLGVGIDLNIAAELREFVKKRGETIRAVVEAALRRHMDNPPPLVPPPPPVYPPLPPVTVPKSARRGKK